MWIKRSVRMVCRVPATVLDWCKNAGDRYRRFVRRSAHHLTMARRESQFGVAPIVNSGAPLHLDFSGKRVELREFLKVLNVGDRVRMFCDDGILVAEKVSKTQFKLIHAEMSEELVH